MTGYELVHLEQGQKAALYAKWPEVFPVALGSADYPMATNRTLTDLHNAIADAHWARKHSDD